MKQLFSWAIVLLFCSTCYSQSANELIAKIKQAQQQLKTIAYTAQRTDTFASSTIRTIYGSAKLKVVRADSVFGFHYYAKRDEPNYEAIYDGRSVISVNHSKKQYSTSYQASSFPHSVGLPAGQLIMPELVRLDTAGATRYEVAQDESHYVLTKYLKDNEESMLVNRYVVYTIDKKNLLPVDILEHAEKAGKTTGNHYSISEIRINEPAYAYNFSAERFPGDYKSPAPQENKVHLALLNNKAPATSLVNFEGKKVSVENLKGKVILLDFWEVWCNPCITSMPKVQALYEKYKNKGLVVYGITCDPQNLASAKEVIKTKKITYPQLSGNKQQEKDYGVYAIPLYIVIDKTGKVSYIHEGFTEEIEATIQKLL